MHHSPDVSVVISTYNRAALLEPAIRTLLDQNVADGVTYEVIVVDNNSSDDTQKVLKALEPDGGGRLRCVFEPRQGLPYGRNAGIEAAAGSIVAFTDDDIRAAPDWVASIKRLFDEHPEMDAVGGRVLPIWGATPPRWLNGRHRAPLAVTDYGSAPFEINAARPLCLVGANFACRREVFSWVGLFSPAFPRGQDHEFQLRLWLAGGRALYAPDLVVYTEVPPSRLTKRYHRRWHTFHGRMCARMSLRERTAPDGAVRECAKVRKTLFGVPTFLFRELAVELREWVAAVAHQEGAEAFAREVAARHLVAYIAERRRLRHSPADCSASPPTVAAGAPLNARPDAKP